MRLVVDLTGVQTQSRFRGIGRYTQGLIAGLARTAGSHEVWLTGADNLGEGLEAARAAFAGLIPAERIVGYRVLDQVRSGIAEHSWRRSASELVRDHFLGSLGADAILFSSMFEGFNEDAVTAVGELTGPALRAVIAYDLIPLLNPNHYLTNPQVKAWYYAKLAAFQRCDLFLAISRSAASEVVDYLGVGGDRVVPIMGGADEFSAAMASAHHEDVDIGTRFGLTKPFFVYAASFDKRKNFENLIAAFARFSGQAGTTHQLALVTSDDAFVRGRIAELAAAAGLTSGDVVVTGQVRDGELRALYKGAVALVHPSTHEGFGLPILEAMHLDAAVIASNSSSIPEIIGWDEAMFDPTSVEDIAEKMARVASDDEFRLRLKQNAVARRGEFSWDRTAAAAWRALEAGCANRPADGSGAMPRGARYDALLSGLRRIDENEAAPSLGDRRALANAIARNLQILDGLALAEGAAAWRIDGPIDATGEAALINRETARALSSLGKTVLQAPVDPSSAREAIVLTGGAPQADGPEGILKIGAMASGSDNRASSAWVDRCNLYLDGIACSSAHARKRLQDSGVAVPLAVVGLGVDHWDLIPAGDAKPSLGKAFRFLHMSAPDRRSGVDVLLAAYGDAFRRDDDVTLIIKTDDRADNPILALLDAARAKDSGFPDVVLLSDHLSDAETKALYRHCHVFAAPGRTEDFGLALAHALMSGLPVITTNWGGQLEFCSERTGWLIDYSFAEAEVGPGAWSSVWAEPDQRALAAALSAARQTAPEALALKAAAGRAILLEKHTWAAVAGRLTEFADRVAGSGASPSAYVAWIGPSRPDGEVQVYSNRMLGSLPLEAAGFAPLPVQDPDQGLAEIAEHVDLAAPDAVVIQLDHPPADVAALERFVCSQKDRSRTVLIDLHAMELIAPKAPPPGVKELLAACDRVVVHTLDGLNRLKAWGLVDGVAWLPHVAPTSDEAAYERVSARLAGLIEALRQDRCDGAAAGVRDGLAATIEAGDRGIELSQEGIGMSSTEQVRGESPGQEDRHGRDLEKLRQERDALQKSLRASLQNVRVLEAQLANARTADPVSPVAEPAALVEQPGVQPPAPPAAIGWRKRLAFLAYRPLRPLVRPMLWRLRGFIVAGVWEAETFHSTSRLTSQQLVAVQDGLQALQQQLLQVQAEIAGVNARLDVDKGSTAEMKRLSHEMEKALLSLAIDASRGPGRSSPDHLPM